jgi:hypothetical protein
LCNFSEKSTGVKKKLKKNAQKFVYMQQEALILHQVVFVFICLG